jgi:hypothetical protein
MNAYDRKRQERFVAAGLTDADIRFAKADYVGEGATSCGLCDHPEIRYIFRLTFERPGAPVVFEPVGSKCIGTWVRALPPSPERDKLLANVEQLDRDARRAAAEARARARREEQAKQDEARRNERTAQASALAPAANVLLAAYDRRISRVPVPADLPGDDEMTLRDIAIRVRERGLSSIAQRDFFADLLRRGGEEVPAEYGRPTRARPTPPPAPKVPTVEGDIETIRTALGQHPGMHATAALEALTRLAVRTTVARPAAPAPAVATPPPPAPVPQGPKCPKCDAPMRLRNGSRGAFYGCSTYPRCKGTMEAAGVQTTMPYPPAPSYAPRRAPEQNDFDPDPTNGRDDLPF